MVVASVRPTTGRPSARRRTSSDTAEPGGRRDGAELLLLGGRDADVEALREAARALLTERHRRALRFWAARSEAPSSLRVWRSPGCEKRSAERPGRSGPWEDTCGASRMCPDKAPSCYPQGVIQALPILSPCLNLGVVGARGFAPPASCYQIRLSRSQRVAGIRNRLQLHTKTHAIRPSHCNGKPDEGGFIHV